MTNLNRYLYILFLFIFAFILSGCNDRLEPVMQPGEEQVQNVPPLEQDASGTNDEQDEPVKSNDGLIDPMEPVENVPGTDNPEDAPGESEDDPEIPGEPEEIDYEVADPNEIGQIMVLMYHGIVIEDPNQYQRTADELWNDLQRLYDGGFRLITMRDLADNNINVPAGMTPVILTFDDGLSSEFSLEENDGELLVKENCAVDIINRFAIEHPDFGRTAMFFINKNPFSGAGTLSDRFNYLIENGYEIGNHSYSHARLKGMSANRIQEEIGKIDQLIRDNTNGYEPFCFSYPYGSYPASSMTPYVMNGVYNGQEYNNLLAVGVGQISGKSATPNHVNFDPSKLPRVTGSDKDPTDLGWHFARYASNAEIRYISDGDPDRISVPSTLIANVNMDNIGEKELSEY